MAARASAKWYILSSAVLVIAAAGIFAAYIFFFPNNTEDSRGRVVAIPRGASFKTAVDSLKNAGVIRNAWTFQLAGRLMGHTRSIKTGKYLFISGLSNSAILRDLKVGKSRLIIPVTLPEGWGMEKIARRYERDLGIDRKQFLALCRDQKFIRAQGIDAESLEGYLLPDTYSFYWQSEEQDIILRMLDGFKKFYGDSLKQRQEALAVSQRQILTLASIVEAETGLKEELPVVAQVYWNRLRKHMRLEADPTVQFALGEEKRLRFDDLDVDSPYNTYRHEGLPPGPIGNPGRAAILATLFPEPNSYLYFVAKGTGGHYFAATFKEHEKNILLYHRTRRQLRHAAQQSPTGTK
jgi:UPF0755 protein